MSTEREAPRSHEQSERAKTPWDDVATTLVAEREGLSDEQKREMAQKITAGLLQLSKEVPGDVKSMLLEHPPKTLQEAKALQSIIKVSDKQSIGENLKRHYKNLSSLKEMAEIRRTATIVTKPETIGTFEHMPAPPVFGEIEVPSTNEIPVKMRAPDQSLRQDTIPNAPFSDSDIDEAIDRFGPEAAIAVPTERPVDEYDATPHLTELGITLGEKSLSVEGVDYQIPDEASLDAERQIANPDTFDMSAAQSPAELSKYLAGLNPKEALNIIDLWKNRIDMQKFQPPEIQDAYAKESQRQIASAILFARKRSAEKADVRSFIKILKSGKDTGQDRPARAA